MRILQATGVAALTLMTQMGCDKLKGEGWSESDKLSFEDDCLKELGRKQKLGSQSIGLCSCMKGKAAKKYDTPKKALKKKSLANLLEACGGGDDESETDEPTSTLKVGDKVEVFWKEKYWPATVLKRKGKRYLIHYDDYGDEWDETVGLDRIRSKSGKEGQPSGGGETELSGDVCKLAKKCCLKIAKITGDDASECDAVGKKPKKECATVLAFSKIKAKELGLSCK